MLYVPHVLYCTVRLRELESQLFFEADGSIYLKISAFAELRKLNFSHNAMGHQGLCALCKNLSAATPITSLSLAGNRLPDEAAATLAGLLLPCSTCQLSFLDLSQSFSLGTAAAVKLAQALEYNTTLHDLQLSNSQLGM